MICEHCQKEIVKIARLSSAQRGDLIEELIQAIECVMGVSRDQLTSHKRYPYWVKARHLCWLIAYERIEGVGLAGLGRRFDGRDHTTIMHGIKAYKTAMSIYPEYVSVYDEVMRNFLKQ